MTASPAASIAFDQLVERLLDQVLDVREAEREQFIFQACGDDQILREAVLAQLLACELVVRDEDFLRGTAAELASQLIEQVEAESAPEAPLESVAAALTGRYEFIKELGRGGSAIVYLARD